MWIEILGHFPCTVRNLHHRIMSYCEKQPPKSTTGDKSENNEPKFTRNSFQGTDYMKWLLVSAVFATCECSKRAILLPPTPATLCKGGFSHVLWGSQSAHALLLEPRGGVISKHGALTALHGKTRKLGWIKVLFMGFSVFSQAGESLWFARRQWGTEGWIYVPACFWWCTLAMQQPQTIMASVCARAWECQLKIQVHVLRIVIQMFSFHYTHLSTPAGSLNQGKWGHNKVQVILAIVF